MYRIRKLTKTLTQFASATSDVRLVLAANTLGISGSESALNVCIKHFKSLNIPLNIINISNDSYSYCGIILPEDYEWILEKDCVKLVQHSYYISHE